MKNLIFFTLFLVISAGSRAGILKGKITDEKGEPVPFASIYVKNTSFGVSSDLKGNYFLELKNGKYTVVFSFIGFETQEQPVEIKNSTTVLNITLKESASELSGVEIYADKRDIAKDIMKKVRDKRKDYLDKVKNYSCRTYQKISLEKEPIDKTVPDTINKTDRYKATGKYNDYKIENKLNLIESVSDMYFDPPGRQKEIIHAYHDFAETNRPFNSGGASMQIEVGEKDIAPLPYEADNPYLLVTDAAVTEFEFYKNLIEVPGICQKQLQSPLATTAPLNYLYDFDGMFYEDGKKIYRIKVSPVFKSEALFSGILFIEDSTWALKAVDLTINPDVLFYCKDFRIIQNYKEVEPGIYMPVRREFFYTIKQGRYYIIGNSRIDHSEHKVNTTFPQKFFSNEIRVYDVDAFDRDSSWWANTRPLTLKETEIEYIKKTDSLREYYASPEYLEKIDSTFNEITVWSFLLNGVGHKNRAKGKEIYFNPLIMQIVPFGVGGYRHRLGGYYNKEFKNAMMLETDWDIDYGFKNKDVKGKVGIGLTYHPKKFIRTFIRIGDTYDLINNYASVSQLFSRSNYVRSQSFSIAQRMEIINGLFGEITFEFSDQKPITNLSLEQWSQDLFDSLNTPVAFERYTKSEIRLDLKYRFKQKYIIKKGRKIILGSKYPELNFIYRKGIPGLLGSQVDFDYIEIGAKHEIKLARFGTSKWNVQAGSFINRTNLRIIEYKYFRGSDPFFFSNPLTSFQLLGPTLSTNTAYLRANYMHHFEGLFGNKIPVINKLKFTSAAGAGTLLIPEQDFAHFEMFAGLERIVRIKKQLFRFGVYAVTKDDTIDKAAYTFKFGISFYNSYTKKWDY